MGEIHFFASLFLLALGLVLLISGAIDVATAIAKIREN